MVDRAIATYGRLDSAFNDVGIEDKRASAVVRLCSDASSLVTGHSLVIDPWGEVLLDAGDEGGVHFADIDLGRIAEVRSRVPALNHRKPIPAVD